MSTPKEYVVVTVVSASLVKNFDWKGRMDPFAVVSWLDGSGTGPKKKLLSRTQTLWNAHKTPEWNFTCRGHAYSGPGSGNQIEIALWEDGTISKAEWMGSAVVDVDELLGGLEPGKHSEDKVLPVLWTGSKKNKTPEQTGTVTVQVVLVEADPDEENSGRKTDDVEVTRADLSLFASPVKRLGVSGGTAPFFALKLLNPTEGKSESHFIGKDLSRAVDEIAFYEEMLRIVNSDQEECGLRDLLAFGFEYAGVLTAPEEGVEDEDADRELLVLRNLRDGCKTLRLLDLKMGEKTASAGWHGKSWSHAYRQGVMDKTTNSYVEGFRLEGFDGRPKTLETMDPLMDYDSHKSAKSLKKASRMLLQHMDGREITMHFLDLHLGPTADADANLDEVYSNAELSEIVLHEIVARLTKLGAVCNNVTIPQKWVGSSVALGFDSGALPPRSKDEASIRSTVLVNIFDWGRSELNTVRKMQHMSPEEQEDRQKFWSYYKGGIERLGWVAARTYLHRFGNAEQWKDVTLTIFDFDAMSRDDFMGSITVPIAETTTTEIKLTDNKGKETAASITFSMHYRPCPDGSRLKGTWRVEIKSAKNLPNMDEKTVSDPYCVVRAQSVDGKHIFEQVTQVIQNDLNPVWEENLDLPLASSSDALVKALEAGKPGMSKDADLFAVLPRREREGTALRSATVSTIRSKKDSDDPGFLDWKERLA